MKGVILINKTINKTSRDMVNELNHIFDIKKIGHTGTLDPLATGVLVMCIGKYTKLVDELSQLQKEYVAQIKLGIKTDTLDITGNILEERQCDVTKESVDEVMRHFVGKMTQAVPMYSAKKINGKKLYEYARSGEEVELPKTNIEVYSLELVDFQDNIITFKALVSKGTYIRSLIRDICDELGVIGTMNSLVRTKQGAFSLENAYTIEEVKSGKYQLLSAKDILPYEVYKLSNAEFQKVKNGNKIKLPFDYKKVILEYDNNDIAIYEKADEVYKVSVMLI